MLSRIAESLFWIGRYVERAEDTARILDVHIHHLLEAPASSETETCQALLDVMGVSRSTSGPGLLRPARSNRARRGDGPDARLVTELLAFSEENPSSIVSSLTAARANARGVSEAISSEMWEALNTTYNALPGQVGLGRRIGPHGFFRFVRERAAVIAGLTDSTMSRDDAWRFLVLGRSIERVDMLARLLTTAVRSGEDDVDWVILLRSCSAHEAFLRTYRREPEPALAAEFLLLDRLFPRSVFCALSTAEVCLAELDPRSDRAGLTDESRRVLGRVRTELEFRRIDDVLEDLPGSWTPCRPDAAPASATLAARYFRQTSPIEWTREGLQPGAACDGGDPIVTWRIQIEHHSRYQYADVVYSSYNEARLTPMTTPRSAGARRPARGRTGPPALSATWTTGARSSTPSTSINPTGRWKWWAGRSWRRPHPTAPDIPPGLGRAAERHRPRRVCRVAGPHRASAGRSPPLDVASGLRAGHSSRRRRAGPSWPGYASSWPTWPAPPRSTPRRSKRGREVRACARTSPIWPWPSFAPWASPGAIARATCIPTPTPRSVPPSTGRATPGSRSGRGRGKRSTRRSARPIGDRHVLVARGRDYADVSPVKGIFHGGQTGRLDVTVGLTRLA